MEHRFSIKRALLDIMYIKEQVYSHFKNRDKYKIILDFIMRREFLDDDIPFPTFKDIEEETGLKGWKIRKLIKDLYEDIFNFEEELLLEFNKVEVNFWVKHYGQFASFSCKNLNHIPKIGEHVDVPFIKAKLNTDFFFVQDIRYRFMDGIQYIDIELKSGFFNSYWYLRRHEAEEKRELAFNDFFDLEEYELKNRLGLGR